MPFLYDVTKASLKFASSYSTIMWWRKGVGEAETPLGGENGAEEKTPSRWEESLLNVTEHSWARRYTCPGLGSQPILTSPRPTDLA